MASFNGRGYTTSSRTFDSAFLEAYSHRLPKTPPTCSHTRIDPNLIKDSSSLSKAHHPNVHQNHSRSQQTPHTTHQGNHLLAYISSEFNPTGPLGRRNLGNACSEAEINSFLFPFSSHFFKLQYKNHWILYGDVDEGVL
jgi:hypothetical protein